MMKRGVELHGQKLATLLAKKARRGLKRADKRQAWADAHAELVPLSMLVAEVAAQAAL